MTLTPDFIEKVTLIQAQAGEIALHPEEHGLDRSVVLKDDHAFDYATAVDNLAEELFKRELRRILPGSGFLGEESEVSDIANRYFWIVDPIDGTAVYSIGGEYYSSSVALVDRQGNDGRAAVIFGSVMQPARGRQFIRTPSQLAVRENYETLRAASAINLRKPRPSNSRGFGEYLGCAFAPRVNRAKHSGVFDTLEKVFTYEEAPELRRSYSAKNARPASGSSALFCCDIADGNRHFAVIFFQKAWDLAVGTLYAKQAGCPVVVFDNHMNPVDVNLEHAIANCTKEPLINVGVFANKHVQSYIMKKLGVHYAT